MWNGSISNQPITRIFQWLHPLSASRSPSRLVVTWHRLTVKCFRRWSYLPFRWMRVNRSLPGTQHGRKSRECWFICNGCDYIAEIKCLNSYSSSLRMAGYINSFSLTESISYLTMMSIPLRRHLACLAGLSISELRLFSKNCIPSSPPSLNPVTS